MAMRNPVVSEQVADTASRRQHLRYGTDCIPPDFV
jgi:hypothetical protein